MEEQVQKIKTGVVFSSGFFGFFAHAGCLSALRDLGIVPAGYSGASSGAIIAAMAAAGLKDEDIKERLFRLRKKDFWDPDPLYRLIKAALRIFKGYTGYLRGEKFRCLMETLPVSRFEECPTPLLITATNLTKRREEVFSEGPIAQAVQASGAVPMLFKPTKIRGDIFLDGGIVSKAPVLALADQIQPQRIIVHFIPSGNMHLKGNGFLTKRLTPLQIQFLALNISRQEGYKRQCEILRREGIEIMDIETHPPPVGPTRMEKGLEAYQKARMDTFRRFASKA